MKQLSTYIQEKLIINKDYIDAGLSPKSFDELRKIIKDRYNKLGPGTKQKPIDFNDIDVSNIDSFYNDKGIGIFDSMDFKYIDISYWDVSNVKSMYDMFFACNKLKLAGDLSKWDVSKVTNMSGMFCGCNELEFIGDISKWNVSNVTNMRHMFKGYNNFNQNISNWNVSSVRNAGDIFHGCPIKDEYKPKFK